MRSHVDGAMRSHQHKNGGKGHPQRSTEELVQVLQAEVVWLRERLRSKDEHMWAQLRSKRQQLRSKYEQIREERRRQDEQIQAKDEHMTKLLQATLEDTKQAFQLSRVFAVSPAFAQECEGSHQSKRARRSAHPGAGAARDEQALLPLVPSHKPWPARRHLPLGTDILNRHSHTFCMRAFCHYLHCLSMPKGPLLP
jgi:hypothetical protein